MMSGVSGMNGMMSGMRPDPQQMYNRVDKNSSSAIEADELSTMTEMMSERTGTTIDAESLMTTFDEDGDGALNQEEMRGAMESLKEQMGRPPMGGPMANGSSVCADGCGLYASGEDATQSLVDQLLDSLSESDEEEAENELTQAWLQTLQGENTSYSPVDTLI